MSITIFYMDTDNKDILLDKRDKEILLKELAIYEREEADLISLYQMLMEVSITDCLPKEHSITYSQNLEKLYQESIKHMKTVKNLMNKYKS